MRWSLTYVATPIAVAVREALFTSSGLTNLTSRGVQSSLQCTASLGTASLGSTLPSWIVPALSAGMRLLRITLCWCCAFRACVSGLLAGGSLGSVAGLALVSFVFRWFLVILDLNLVFRVTVSPAKPASPKFMKMVSFCSFHSL